MMTIPFKNTEKLMKNRMNICNVDLRHVQQQRRQQTKQSQFKTIWIVVVYTNQHVSQLGFSLQLGIMSVFQENAFVFCVHSGLICCNKGGVVQLLASYITTISPLSFRCVNFSPRRGYPGVLKFTMGSLLQKYKGYV